MAPGEDKLSSAVPVDCEVSLVPGSHAEIVDDAHPGCKDDGIRPRQCEQGDDSEGVSTHCIGPPVFARGELHNKEVHARTEPVTTSSSGKMGLARVAGDAEVEVLAQAEEKSQSDSMTAAESAGPSKVVENLKASIHSPSANFMGTRSKSLNDKVATVVVQGNQRRKRVAVKSHAVEREGVSTKPLVIVTRRKRTKAAPEVKRFRTRGGSCRNAAESPKRTSGRRPAGESLQGRRQLEVRGSRGGARTSDKASLAKITRRIGKTKQRKLNCSKASISEARMNTNHDEAGNSFQDRTACLTASRSEGEKQVFDRFFLSDPPAFSVSPSSLPVHTGKRPRLLQNRDVNSKSDLWKYVDSYFPPEDETTGLSTFLPEAQDLQDVSSVTQWMHSILGQLEVASSSCISIESAKKSTLRKNIDSEIKSCKAQLTQVMQCSVARGLKHIIEGANAPRSRLDPSPQNQISNVSLIAESEDRVRKLSLGEGAKVFGFQGRNRAWRTELRYISSLLEHRLSYEPIERDKQNGNPVCHHCEADTDSEVLYRCKNVDGRSKDLGTAHASRRAEETTAGGCLQPAGHECQTEGIVTGGVNQDKEGLTMRCAKYFCESCLRKVYNVRVRGEQGTMGDRWKCPFCRGNCFCWDCVMDRNVAKLSYLWLGSDSMNLEEEPKSGGTPAAASLSKSSTKWQSLLSGEIAQDSGGDTVKTSERGKHVLDWYDSNSASLRAGRRKTGSTLKDSRCCSICFVVDPKAPRSDQRRSRRSSSGGRLGLGSQRRRRRSSSSMKAGEASECSFGRERKPATDDEANADVELPNWFDIHFLMQTLSKEEAGGDLEVCLAREREERVALHLLQALSSQKKKKKDGNGQQKERLMGKLLTCQRCGVKAHTSCLALCRSARAPWERSSEALGALPGQIEESDVDWETRQVLRDWRESVLDKVLGVDREGDLGAVSSSAVLTPSVASRSESGDSKIGGVVGTPTSGRGRKQAWTCSRCSALSDTSSEDCVTAAEVKMACMLCDRRDAEAVLIPIPGGQLSSLIDGVSTDPSNVEDRIQERSQTLEQDRDLDSCELPSPEKTQLVHGACYLWAKTFGCQGGKEITQGPQLGRGDARPPSQQSSETVPKINSANVSLPKSACVCCVCERSPMQELCKEESVDDSSSILDLPYWNARAQNSQTAALSASVQPQLLLRCSRYGCSRSFHLWCGQRARFFMDLRLDQVLAWPERWRRVSQRVLSERFGPVALCWEHSPVEDDFLSYQRLVDLRNNLDKMRLLLEMIKRRERQKKREIELQTSIFELEVKREKRSRRGRKRKLPEALSLRVAKQEGRGIQSDLSSMEQSMAEHDTTPRTSPKSAEGANSPHEKSKSSVSLAPRGAGSTDVAAGLPPPTHASASAFAKPNEGAPRASGRSSESDVPTFAKSEPGAPTLEAKVCASATVPLTGSAAALGLDDPVLRARAARQYRMQRRKWQRARRPSVRAKQKQARGVKGKKSVEMASKKSSIAAVCKAETSRTTRLTEKVTPLGSQGSDQVADAGVVGPIKAKQQGELGEQAVTGPSKCSITTHVTLKESNNEAKLERPKLSVSPGRSLGNITAPGEAGVAKSEGKGDLDHSAVAFHDNSSSPSRSSHSNPLSKAGDKEAHQFRGQNKLGEAVKVIGRPSGPFCSGGSSTSTRPPSAKSAFERDPSSALEENELENRNCANLPCSVPNALALPRKIDTKMKGQGVYASGNNSIDNNHSNNHNHKNNSNNKKKTPTRTTGYSPTRTFTLSSTAFTEGEICPSALRASSARALPLSPSSPNKQARDPQDSLSPSSLPSSAACSLTAAYQAVIGNGKYATLVRKNSGRGSKPAGKRPKPAPPAQVLTEGVDRPSSSGEAAESWSQSYAERGAAHVGTVIKVLSPSAAKAMARKGLSKSVDSSSTNSGEVARKASGKIDSLSTTPGKMARGALSKSGSANTNCKEEVRKNLSKNDSSSSDSGEVAHEHPTEYGSSSTNPGEVSRNVLSKDCSASTNSGEVAGKALSKSVSSSTSSGMLAGKGLLKKGSLSTKSREGSQARARMSSPVDSQKQTSGASFCKTKKTCTSRTEQQTEWMCGNATDTLGAGAEGRAGVQDEAQREKQQPQKKSKNEKAEVLSTKSTVSTPTRETSTHAGGKVEGVAVRQATSSPGETKPSQGVEGTFTVVRETTRPVKEPLRKKPGRPTVKKAAIRKPGPKTVGKQTKRGGAGGSIVEVSSSENVAGFVSEDVLFVGGGDVTEGCIELNVEATRMSFSSQDPAKLQSFGGPKDLLDLTEPRSAGSVHVNATTEDSAGSRTCNATPVKSSSSCVPSSPQALSSSAESLRRRTIESVKSVLSSRERKSKLKKSAGPPLSQDTLRGRGDDRRLEMQSDSKQQGAETAKLSVRLDFGSKGTSQELPANSQKVVAPAISVGSCKSQGDECAHTGGASRKAKKDNNVAGESQTSEVGEQVLPGGGGKVVREDIAAERRASPSCKTNQANEAGQSQDSRHRGSMKLSQAEDQASHCDYSHSSLEKFTSQIKDGSTNAHADTAEGAPVPAYPMRPSKSKARRRIAEARPKAVTCMGSHTVDSSRGKDSNCATKTKERPDMSQSAVQDNAVKNKRELVVDKEVSLRPSAPEETKGAEERTDEEDRGVSGQAQGVRPAGAHALALLRPPRRSERVADKEKKERKYKHNRRLRLEQRRKPSRRSVGGPAALAVSSGTPSPRVGGPAKRSRRGRTPKETSAETGPSKSALARDKRKADSAALRVKGRVKKVKT